MKTMYCRVCGAEIVITYMRSDKSFRIQNNSLVRDDNNFGDNELIFHCSDDMEHDIDPQPQDEISIDEFYEWEEEVEKYFREIVVDHI